MFFQLLLFSHFICYQPNREGHNFEIRVEICQLIDKFDTFFLLLSRAEDVDLGRIGAEVKKLDVHVALRFYFSQSFDDFVL